ncbi:hypothetical protein M406DRAFT_234864, partial [Cryphonectria parasitica EP155]
RLRSALKCSNCARLRFLVSPSAGMLCVGIYETWNLPFWNSCLSHIWSRKRRCKAIVSLAVAERAYSSASVVEVVTRLCFVAFHCIGPPNRLKIYPCEDFRSS